MKYLKIVLLTVILASILCISAYAAESGIDNLSIVNTANTQITMYEANGTAGILPVNGVYANAERFSVTYSAASQGQQYVVFVLSGDETVPTESNILYIDQAVATGSTVSFNVYPKNITSGGSIYISGGGMGLTKLASYGYFDLSSAFTVSLSDETVSSGGTVTVDVDLSNNPGIGATTLYVYYDTGMLTYTGKLNGSLWETHKAANEDATSSLSVNATTEDAVGWDDHDGANENIIAIGLMTDVDLTGNGTVVSLTFNAVAVTSNTTTNLNLFCSRTTNNANSSVGILTLTNDATIAIKVYKPGDVDDDGIFTASDALMALQVSVGKTGFTDNQKLAANVDGDTIVTASDALMILQRSVGKITSFAVEEIIR